MYALPYNEARVLCLNNDAEFAAITNENEWNFIQSDDFWATYPEEDLFYWNNVPLPAFWLGSFEDNDASSIADAKFYWKDTHNENLRKNDEVDISFMKWAPFWDGTPGVCNSNVDCRHLKAGRHFATKADQNLWDSRPLIDTAVHDPEGMNVGRKNRTGVNWDWSWTDWHWGWHGWTMCQIRI